MNTAEIQNDKLVLRTVKNNGVIIYQDDIERVAPLYSGNRELAIMQALYDSGAPIDIENHRYSDTVDWYREDIDYDFEVGLAVEGIKIYWEEPDDLRHYIAHSSCQAGLQFRIDTDAGFREGTDDLLKYLGPGDIIESVRVDHGKETNTLYLVKRISKGYSAGHVCYSLAVRTADSPEDYYLHELVYVNGEILKLFGTNEDYVKILNNVPEAFTHIKPPETQFNLL